MEIPADKKTFEMSSSILWFDEDGILFSIPKPGMPPELTMDEILQEMEKFRVITGNKKVCMIAESNSKSRPPNKSERDFIAEQINSVTKAMAIITISPVTRMIANLFFALKPPTYPAKMFTNEKEAKEWIRQYI
jgi:hypothetical protein